MKSLILYTKHIRNVSGVQTFEYAFLQQMSSKYEITVIYEIGDKEQIDRFKQYAKVIRAEGLAYKADICVYSTVFRKNSNIIADKYVQVVHTDYEHWKVDYDPTGIDEHIAVSVPIAEVMKRKFNVDCSVIPNILPIGVYTPAMRFMSATRVAKGKGIERIFEFVKKLEEARIPFVFEIYGAGSRNDMQKYSELFEGYPGVKFMGETMSIESFMEKNDYIVQLSDNEGYCYSIYEAIRLGKPVIVTNWNGVENIVTNGKNGYIVDMDLNNLDIHKIVYAIPSQRQVLTEWDRRKPDYNQAVKDWKFILDN